MTSRLQSVDLPYPPYPHGGSGLVALDRVPPAGSLTAQGASR